MNPFAIVAYCQSNFPSISSSLSSLPHFYQLHHPGKKSRKSKKKQKKTLATSLHINKTIDKGTVGISMRSSHSLSTSSTTPRYTIRRNNSMSSVQSSPTVYDPKLNKIAGRVSMDSYDRTSIFSSSSTPPVPVRTFSSSSSSSASSTTNKPAVIPTKSSRHKKSSSSPPELFSPPLGPTSTSSISNPSTPLLASSSSLAPIPSIILENEVEALDLQQPGASHNYYSHSHSHYHHQYQQQYPYRHHPSSEETAPIAPPTTPPLTSLFFGRGSGSSVSNTPASTPPASPALHAARTYPSVSPSPSTTPPSSPSLSFLGTWQGRLPSIPRPSPMTPLRAAKKVVTSVTSVGTGLLPSKEQLGSIPVAGRILTHPVMDSTLTYIASKTTLGGGKGVESKPITPEDAPYLKLNRKLIDQSITLANLAIEKEELSKTMDDEAADDAFELYLAAIATLMHSLPIETCDPLRREAFQSQLRSFLDEHQFDVITATKDNPDLEAKQRRRLRRKRHREYREQAKLLIHQYSIALTAADYKASTVAAIASPIGGRRSSAPSSLPASQQFPTAAPQVSALSPDQGASSTSSSYRRRRRHRRRRGKNQGHLSDEYDDSPTLGDTIISTAVESAIRLKQSPIPDVLRTCFRASRVILSKVDEKFHLQEKAWQLSKHSIEKAIELDEQYAIHEVVTETFFATVTGLVKAGIAYKETPGYGTVRATSTAPTIESKSTQGPALLLAPPPATTELPRSQNPQAILPKKSSSMLSFPWRRHSVIEEEKDSEYEKSRSNGDEFDDNDDDDDDDTEGEEESTGKGYNSSSSCFTTSEDSQVDNDDYESEDGYSYRRRRRHSSQPYTDQIRQRLDMLMTLRGIASYVAGGK